MTLKQRLADHNKALRGVGRPAAPVDPSNPMAEDSIALADWLATAPKKLSCLGEDLRDGDFSKADLRMAGLKECDLRDCNFRKADLRGADLRGCKLEGANFFGATLDASTRISGIDLGKGLANRSSLITLMEGLGGDAEEEQTNALLLALKRMTR